MIFNKTVLSYSVALTMLAGVSQFALANTTVTSHATTETTATDTATTTAETTATTDTAHTTATTEATGSTSTTDRASYGVGDGKLHIPYITVDGVDGGYSADLVNTGSDANGNMTFSLDVANNLHTIHAPHWTYTGSTAPAYWGGMTTDYAACSAGKTQSPIDISTSSAVATSLTPISFSYTSSALNIVNNGHTIQSNYDSGSSITVNGNTYNLLQFHFHAPSEHNIDATSFPLEIHFVHSDANGNLAVIGVMVTEGAENANFADVIANIPATETAETTIDGVTISAESMLPTSRLEYRYSGSLTTPPCSEGVQWLVLKDSIEMSAAQIAAFAPILNHNNRPLQPVNARNIISNQ